MWFLWILSWISLAVQVCFATLSIAAGLYYLAELVEEYSVMSGKVIRWLTLVTIGVYGCLFLFEGFPTYLVLCGLVAQILHLVLLASFPFFALLSPQFMATIAMVLINHYLAFTFFAENYYPFSQVLAYFTLCLWLVPFGFFVSLSANENVLPTLSEKRPLLSDENDVVSNYFMRKEKKYGLRAVIQGLKEQIFPSRTKKGF